MTRLDPRTIDRIREASNLVDVVGTYTRLKKQGDQYWSPCPFHKETVASFAVHPQKQVWRCYAGCGSGNVFSFLQKIEGISFRAACEFLADRYGIPLETATREERLAAMRRAEAQRRLVADTETVRLWLKRTLSTAYAMAHAASLRLTNPDDDATWQAAMLEHRLHQADMAVSHASPDALVGLVARGGMAPIIRREHERTERLERRLRRVMSR